ncbi:ABC transporter ATP-binding protein [Isobaculum melis]|uniref:ATP-binding cassette, subfamily B n=1 Tax=Isobaculum melis TaxID=142588 RepID=A0A1H9TCB0_9LACT|nr:ABC transporter ATP-binding protein [Isobaculum melis]SER94852.1 ATP-binding cassette, subfamily B [Isobaculum melis]
MFKLLKYAKKYRLQMIIGPIFKFIEAVFELFLPLLMANLIDNGINKGDRAYIIQMGGWMLLMSVIGVISVFICQYSASIASQGFGTELRNRLMKKIAGLSYEELDELGTATLITRVTNDVNQMQVALAMLIRMVIRAPFLSIGALVMSIYINPKLSLIFAVVLPLFLFILYLVMLKTIPMYRYVQKKVDQIALVIGENISGVRVIRAFARRRTEKKRVAEASDDLAKAYIRVSNLSALMNPATTLVMNFGIIVLLYIGGFSVNSGAAQQGEILALVNYLIQMLTAMIMVANLVVIFTRAAASASRINEVLAIKEGIQDPEISLPVPVASSQIPVVEFKTVSFSYGQAEEKALEKIHLTFNQGETIGIVGTTGSGKSTLAHLIPRFYDATEGEVLVNGHSVKQYQQEALREIIGIVPQKSVLFAGTISDNLRMAKKEATDAEIMEALAISQSLSFVEKMDETIHAPVQEGGMNFSGGQKQRLTIARAVLKKPEILIIDDGLSALDYRTDLQVRAALKKQLQNTTIVIISQRISSIMQADQILVLDDGKLVGHGKHEWLLKHCAVYQEIYQSQVNETTPAAGLEGTSHE